MEKLLKIGKWKLIENCKLIIENLSDKRSE